MHDFLYTITRTFSRAIFPALTVMAVGGVILALLYWKWYGKETRFTLRQSTAVLLLLGYLGGLTAITLLLRMDGARMGMQTHFLLAFWEAWNAFTFQVWLNPLLNIAMFLPLGVLLPLAAKPFRRWRWTLAAGAGASLVIEILQYLLGRGQADVDDLFCNTLGAMLGYCLCMTAVSLVKKRWKPAGAYAALPVLSAAVLAGVFLTYYLQPYGNLAGAPIFPADTSGTNWMLECELSDKSELRGVYWTEPFTAQTCDAFAAEFLSRVGAEIDFDRDVDYYDNTTYYSDHNTYCLIVNHNDRSYEYSDYRIDFSFEGAGTSTEEKLRAELLKLGISVPEAAEFILNEEGSFDTYSFRAHRLEENGVFFDGELTCWVAEGGALYKADNHMTVSTLKDEFPVISEREAYDRLRAGRFSQADVYIFEHMDTKDIHVTACTLRYLTDSKGYRQPVYYFSLSNEEDMILKELGGTGSNWQVFVPALAR